MESPLYLMKFQDLERLKEIQCGNIYMKNLEYFIKLEEKEKEKFRADAGEDRIPLPPGKLKISDIDGDGEIELDVKKGFYSGGHLKNPVFCLFSLDYRNIIKSGKAEVMRFSSRQKIELKKFGTHALLIDDANEFMNRISVALDSMKYGYRFGFVKYYKKGEEIRRFADVADNSEHIVFTNEFEPFSIQQEYRIFVETEVEDHFRLYIGDISDITHIESIDKVLETDYEV